MRRRVKQVCPRLLCCQKNVQQYSGGVLQPKVAVTGVPSLLGIGLHQCLSCAQPLASSLQKAQTQCKHGSYRLQSPAQRSLDSYSPCSGRTESHLLMAANKGIKNCLTIESISSYFFFLSQSFKTYHVQKIYMHCQK